MSRELVTIPQALAARPWLTERFLRRLVAEQRIPYHKVAGRVLFDLADLDDLAERNRVEPPRPLRLLERRRRTGT